MSSETQKNEDVNNTSSKPSIWNKKMNPLYKDVSSVIGKEDERFEHT